MQVESYQCRACKYVLSDPVDVCPVCNAHFYWMVLPHGKPAPDEISFYVEEMNMLVGGQTNRDFLTHGGHYWLPHNFWSYNPDGSILAQFSWIRDIRFLQHDADEQRVDEKRRSADPNPWDTNPGITVVVSDDDEEDVVVIDEAPVWGMASSEPQPEPELEPEVVQPQAPVQMTPETESEVADNSPAREALIAATGQLDATPMERGSVKTRARKPSPSGPRSKRAVWFVPVMLFVFFMLLSLAWFVLLYHRNNRPDPTPVEVTRIPFSQEVDNYGTKVLSRMSGGLQI